MKQARPADVKSTLNIIRAAVPADRSWVRLEMMPGSGASGQITLTPHGLDLLIQTLGRVRAAMAKGQAIPPFDLATIEPVVDSRWQVSPALMGEASAFIFHHPAYGPMSFVVPIDQVERIVAVLSQHVGAASAAKRAPKS